MTEEPRAFGGSRFRQFRDDGADSGTGFKQAGRDQVRDYFVSGVGIDFEFFAEETNGGEWISGTQLSGNDGFGSGVDNLLVKGDAGPEVDAERDHRCVL